MAFRSACKKVVKEDFPDKELNIKWIPIEW